MSKVELVSVVIPTYNRSKQVIVAIESVLAQLYSNIEIIVVDDGSTDNTAHSLKQFSEEISYHFTKNSGVSSARNLGIRVAKGKYIAFLDSDDLWSETKVKRQVEFFRLNPDFGLVLTDCLFFDNSGNTTEQTNRRFFLPLDGYNFENVLLKPSFIPSTAMVKAEVLDDIGLFDNSLKTAEDLDLHLRIAAKYKIGLIDEPLTQCSRGELGLSQGDQTYDDYIFVVERFIQHNPKIISREIQRNARYNMYLAASNGKYWRGECQTGLRYALSALKNASNGKQCFSAFRNLLKSVKYFFYQG